MDAPALRSQNLRLVSLFKRPSMVQTFYDAITSSGLLFALAKIGAKPAPLALFDQSKQRKMQI
jgi:hypothetical protein